MSELVGITEEFIKARQLLKRGDGCLVAVSGGVDSIVLLDVLKKLSERHRWRLVVGHFNHQLRGRQSDQDQDFVQQAAARLELECWSDRGNVRELANRKRLSIEMAARQLRHAFFARACSKLRLKKVALAHHGDDQVELFYLRLLRGASGSGLGGMRAAGPSPSDPKLELVRPFLGLRKAELEGYAKDQGLRFRRDASNELLDHDRNRIRHELLPWLEAEYNAGLRTATHRTMELLAAESEFVAETARRWLEGKRRMAFKDLHRAVQRHLVVQGLIALGVPLDFDCVERLRLAPGKVFSAGSGKRILLEPDGKVRLAGPSVMGFNRGELPLDVTATKGQASFDGLSVRWHKADSSTMASARQRRQAGTEVFDADKLGACIVLRHWRPGDRFKPIGMAETVKVQDLLTNAKVPRASRYELAFGTTASNEIFWIEGLRISEQFKVHAHTRRALVWSWQRL